MKKISNFHYNKKYYSGKNSNYICGYSLLKHRIFWKRRLQTLYHFSTGGKLLDMGCAYGYFLSHLAPTFEGYGIDISPFAISKARKILPEHRVQVADISKDKIPFGIEFDVITVFDVLEHFDNFQKIISNIKNHLKPEGILYIEVPTSPPILDRDNHYYASKEQYIDVLEKEGFSRFICKGFFTIGSRVIMLKRNQKYNYLQLVARKSKEF